MRIDTQWVRLAADKRGEDHLAVQAPSVALYSQLLPGISNVTDRARYYSFYPWLLWNLKRRPSLALTPLQVVRRGECLFTLIASRHAEKLSQDEALHGVAMVGRNTLMAPQRELESGGHLDLLPYAALEGEHPKRYFKNRYGGLGQYYLGPLRELGVLAGDSSKGPQFTTERGGPLAENMEAGADSNAFFSVLEAGSVDEATLDALADFCPCRLPASTREHTALLELFFDRKQVHGETGRWRRNSLALLLDLLSQLQPKENPQALFRAAVYAGSVHDGKTWSLPQELEATRQAWAVYQRSELLSVAVQGVFWVALRLVGKGMRVQGSAAVAQRVRELAREVLEARASLPFSQAVAAKRLELPDLVDWRATEHEQSLATAMEDAVRRGETEKVLAQSLQVMVALATRDESHGDPYRGFLPSDYFRAYGINLWEFRRCAREVWSSLSLEELAGWLAARWGVETHLRVALRKLHQDSQDTFLVRPMDGALHVVSEAPPPGFTSPRLRTALRMLIDLGLVALGEHGSLSVTPDGQKMLEELHG
ncbi:hypothetical protein [Archangium sp.]|jgi:hypothetical protein|uniref:hypothetical protein n=1 Tax=Archangium sp. TaxID=1872627 RepID=UPI002ED808A8